MLVIVFISAHCAGRSRFINSRCHRDKMSDHKKCSKAIVILLFLNLLVMFLYISYSNRMHHVDYKRYHIKGHHRRRVPAKVPVAKRRLSPYANLDECILKEVDPLATEFMPYNPNYNPKENCTIYKPMTTLDPTYGFVKVLAKNATCTARCITPKSHTSYETSFESELKGNISFQCDFIETKCRIKKFAKNFLRKTLEYESVEHYLHIRVIDIDSISDKPLEKHLPDVYVLVLDSVSTSMAKRALPKTLAFLQTKMKAVQFSFLNKVGRTAIQTRFHCCLLIEGVSRIGRKAEPPDWDQCSGSTRFPSFLDSYKKKGYKTMIAQDSPGFESYDLCKKWFDRPEADHIYRPFHLRAKEKELKENLFGETCGESHHYMLNYLRKFMNAYSYSGSPKIAFIWSTILTRGSINNLYHTDDHFLRFFKRNQKALRNSFLFFLGFQGPHSDGIQKTRLGRHDNKNPFLVIAIPEDLRNTGIYHALKENSQKLITHFDVHATLRDILHEKSMNIIQSARNSAFNKGSSLLRRWTRSRTCNNLPIPVEYCLCQYNKKELKDDRLRERVGEFIASQLNAYLTNVRIANVCVNQEYEKTLDAQQLRVGENTTLYSMFVRLKPMKGDFTAEVLGTPSGFQLVSGFNRWDHRKRGHCAPKEFSSLCQCSST